MPAGNQIRLGRCSELGRDMDGNHVSLLRAFGPVCSSFLIVSQVLSYLSFQGVYLYIVPYFMGAGYSGEKAATLFGFANLTTISCSAR